MNSGRVWRTSPGPSHPFVALPTISGVTGKVVDGRGVRLRSAGCRTQVVPVIGP